MTMTFNELYGQFVPVKRLEVKISTINRYRMDWKFLESKIGEMDIAEFGRQNARFLVATMIEEGLSPKLARDRIYFVKQLLIYAAQELEMRVKPLDWKLKFPAGKPREIQRFTESEMLRIAKAVTEEIEGGTYSGLPVLMALLTGMRMGEILALRWGDVDFVHNIIKVQRNVVKSYDPEAKTERMMIGTPKTSHGYREIPLLPTLRKAFRAVGGPKPEPGNYIVGNSDKPKFHNCVRDTYSRLLKRNKLPTVNFHGLRHTFATLLVESGGDIKTISVMLGHSTVALTLNLYVHPSLESKRKVVNKAFRKLRKLSLDASVNNENGNN